MTTLKTSPTASSGSPALPIPVWPWQGHAAHPSLGQHRDAQSPALHGTEHWASLVALQRGRNIAAAATSTLCPHTQPTQHRPHQPCCFPKHSAKLHPFLWDCQPISWIINSSKASRCFSIWACLLPFVLSPVLPYISQGQIQLPPGKSFTKISRWNTFSH